MPNNRTQKSGALRGYPIGSKEIVMADYETVSLESDQIGVAAAQMNPVIVNAANPAAGKRTHLEHMLYKSGMYQLQFRADCATSNLYGVYSNGGSGVAFNGISAPENGFGGSSMVVDFFGRVLNEAHDSREAIVFEQIPIASFRKSREKPSIRSELYAKVYETTPEKYPSNLYSDHGVPENAMAAIELAARHARY
jgi:hypothetical protein